MSKAHLLVICLLAASFTGCLGSDDIEPSIVKEEDTIEPVGTGDNGGNETNNYNETNHYYYNNDTYYVNGTDYLELISQVENLTAEVEALRLEIEEMQSSKYNVPANSSIWIHDQHAENRDFEIIKNGSTITVEYRGDNLNNYFNTTYPRNCTIFTPSLNFYNVDGVMIKSFNAHSSLWHDAYGEFWMDGVEIIRECAFLFGPASQDIRQYWSTIIITLPEEPVRVDADNGYYTFY